MAERSPGTSDAAWRALLELLARGGREASEPGAGSGEVDEPSVELLQLLRGRAEDSAALARRDRLLAELAKRASPADRFVALSELGRGGMGLVREVWDPELERKVALKLQLGDPHAGEDASGGVLERLVFERRRDRMLEEAEIMAQLDTPGVVPLHELGLDRDGRAFLVMPLVRGESFLATLRRVHEGDPAWPLPRALAVLERAARLVARAHARGVVHRDLKPDNLLVGEAGEVRLVDWGLAKALEDDRAVDEGSEGAVRVRTLRGGATGSASPLYTREGDVLGTPAYMAPERAGTRSAPTPEEERAADVYGLGATLYHLLAGHAPYADLGSREGGAERDAGSPSPRAVLDALERGAPTPLSRVGSRAGALGERALHAACERAMAREPAERYADAAELADDLRAVLEHRALRALGDRRSDRVRKLLRRNAVAIASVALPVVAFCVLALPWLARALDERAEAEHARAGAEARRDAAEREERRAREKLAALDGLELGPVVDALEREARELGPALPSRRARLADWVARTRPVAAKLAALERLAARDRPGEALAPLDELVVRRALAPLVTRLRAFAGDDAGAGDTLGVHGTSLADVARRLELAERIARVERAPPPGTTPWSELVADVARPDGRYGGLTLAPREGLVPLRRDPESGLWELWHVASGEPPRAGPDGAWRILPETGLVLVLVPGAEVELGAQAEDPAAPRYDPDATPGEGPPHRVELDAFYLSKYELTQAQWHRLTGTRPSVYSAERAGHDGTAPVESVAWTEAADALRLFGLELPTEAQWEHAARGGRPFAPWTGGGDPRALAGAGNLNGDDGHDLPGPVGRFAPNGYGLFDVVGNVREWCRDDLHLYERLEPRPGDGLRRREGPNGKVVRGAGYRDGVEQARVTWRTSFAPDERRGSLGLRPSAGLDG